MRRIPGKKEDKINYLKSLSQVELPYLVSDILALKYGHEDIRILDGPGDGRRDIQSKFKNNDYIIQCKFHDDPSKTSGSRELDEIIIALAKFNKTHGIFATSGKISPQAKREYIDNYPNYTLDYIEGLNIVEIVLSDKVLRRLWYDGEKLGQVLNRVVIPFTLRQLSDNKQVKIDAIDGLYFREETQNLTYELNQAYEIIDQFDPYSEPAGGFASTIDNRVDAYCLTISGPVSFVSYTAYVEILAEKFIGLGILGTGRIAIRFGRPYFEGLAEKSNFKGKDKLGLPHPPVTILINKENWIYEQAYYIDTAANWRHPKLIQMSTLSDYGRYNEENDVICYVEYSCSVEIPRVSSLKQRIEAARVFLSKSLAIVGTEDEINNFKQQEFSCDFKEYPYGPGGKLLLWEYPAPDVYILDH